MKHYKARSVPSRRTSHERRASRAFDFGDNRTSLLLLTFLGGNSRVAWLRGRTGPDLGTGVCSQFSERGEVVPGGFEAPGWSVEGAVEQVLRESAEAVLDEGRRVDSSVAWASSYRSERIGHIAV